MKWPIQKTSGSFFSKLICIDDVFKCAKIQYTLHKVQIWQGHSTKEHWTNLIRRIKMKQKEIDQDIVIKMFYHLTSSCRKLKWTTKPFDFLNMELYQIGTIPCNSILSLFMMIFIPVSNFDDQSLRFPSGMLFGWLTYEITLECEDEEILGSAKSTYTCDLRKTNNIKECTKASKF